MSVEKIAEALRSDQTQEEKFDILWPLLCGIIKTQAMKWSMNRLIKTTHDFDDLESIFTFAFYRCIGRFEMPPGSEKSDEWVCKQFIAFIKRVISNAGGDLKYERESQSRMPPRGYIQSTSWSADDDSSRGGFDIPNRDCEAREVFEIVQYVIKSIKPRDRYILKRHFSGLKCAEIANELGVSISTVNNSFANVRNKIFESPELVRGTGAEENCL